MRRLALGLLLTAAAILMAAGPGGAATVEEPVDETPVDDECSDARRLTDEGLVTDAVDMLAALIAGDDTPECAQPEYERARDLQRTALDWVEQGRTHATLDAPWEALAAFEEALAIDRSLDEAVAERDAVVASLSDNDEEPVSPPACKPVADVAKREYEDALRLNDAGYEDEARTKAQEIAAADGTTCAIPSDLEAPDKATVDRLTDFAKLFGTWVGVIAILFALGWISFHILRKLTRRPRSARWLWKKVRTTRPLRFDDIKSPAGGPDIGHGLAVILGGQVARSGGGGNLRGYVSYDEAPTVQDITLPEELAPVGSFLTWLRSPETITLEGDAFRLSGGRVGLAVRLVDHRSRVKATETFVGPGSTLVKAEDRAKDAEVFYSLVPGAAAWVREELAKLRGDTPEFIGTSDRESYTAYSRGVRQLDLADFAQAGLRFREAVRHDPKNMHAQFNLGHAEFSQSAAAGIWDRPEKVHEALDRAISAFTTVIETTRAANGPQPEPLWYRATYMRSVARLTKLAHLRNVGSPDSTDEEQRELIDAAKKEADALVSAIAEGLKPDSSDARPKELIAEFEPDALTLQLGAVAYHEALASDAPDDAPGSTYDELERQFSARFPEPTRAPITAYNMACNHVARRREGWAERAYEAVEQALVARPSWRTETARDPELQPLRDDPAYGPKFIDLTTPESKPSGSEPATVWRVTYPPPVT